MSKIITCKVLNQSNKIENEEIMVCSEWFDSKIKVLIIRSNNTVLNGEVLLEDFRIYAETFDKTLQAYLKETEDILSGLNDEVEFFVDDHTFYWRRKRWALGKINVKLITELKSLKDFTLHVIDQYSKIKNSAIELEKDNENLKSKYSALINKVNEIILLKEELEQNLYKKFILIINSKKAKIRELKSKLEKLENKNTIYDAVTDESDDESDDIKNNVSSHNSIIKKSVNKRLFSTDIEKKISEKRQKSEIILDNVSSVDDNEIKSKKIDIESKTLKIKSLSVDIGEDEETPDFLSDESECEVELKFEEENVEGESRKNLSTSIMQEDSSEEMF